MVAEPILVTTKQSMNVRNKRASHPQTRAQLEKCARKRELKEESDAKLAKLAEARGISVRQLTRDIAAETVKIAVEKSFRVCGASKQVRF